MTLWIARSFNHIRKEFLHKFQFRCVIMASNSSASYSSHLERTADNFRQKSTSEAEVISITDVSETVKLLKLKIADKEFSFKAGQWVDFVVPGVERVGGFSMFTSPIKLKENGTLGLAVKNSEQEPAHWVHTKCVIGSQVSVRVGGDQLVYDPQPDSPSWNLLLVAGGIGINPLFSVLNRVCDFHSQTKMDGRVYKPGHVELLYSACTQNELIFKKSITEMVQTHPDLFSSRYFITKSNGANMKGIVEHEILERRISEDDIKVSLSRLKKGPLLCFVCGPPPMIDSMEQILLNHGVPKEAIIFEKWW